MLQLAASKKGFSEESPHLMCLNPVATRWFNSGSTDERVIYVCKVLVAITAFKFALSRMGNDDTNTY